jgi:hypothetical protein
MAEPSGLPPVDQCVQADDRSAIDTARFCPRCKQEARIVSSRSGIAAYCGPCRKSWTISTKPLVSDIPPTMPRPLQKETWIEPDWNMADAPTHGDVTNEQVGPKPRR